MNLLNDRTDDRWSGMVIDSYFLFLMSCVRVFYLRCT